MVIDANGNKWFATTDGLMKFDGTNWTTFNTSNSSLKFNTINDLAVDLNGNVWLAAGSEDETGNETTGRIVKYDGTNWIYFNPFNDNNGLNYVYTIAVDSTGKIWAGTSFGLTVFNGINWTNYTDSHSATEKLEIHSIAFDSHGNKWFGTMCGILKFQDNSAAVNNLHSDKKVAIWPNPTNSYLNIKLFDQSIIDNISVYDSKGSLLVKKENVSMDNFQLNISEFQQGLYFVFVNAGTNRIAKQIFKTK